MEFTLKLRKSFLNNLFISEQYIFLSIRYLKVLEIKDFVDMYQHQNNKAFIFWFLMYFQIIQIKESNKQRLMFLLNKNNNF